MGRKSGATCRVLLRFLCPFHFLSCHRRKELCNSVRWFWFMLELKLITPVSSPCVTLQEQQEQFNCSSEQQIWTQIWGKNCCFAINPFTPFTPWAAHKHGTKQTRNSGNYSTIKKAPADLTLGFVSVLSVFQMSRC